MFAALAGSLDCVHFLLDNHAEIESEDAEGWTALHYSAMSKNKAVTEILLKRNATIRRESTRGQLPIHVALISCDADIASLLLAEDKGCINHCDSDGLAPIHLATMKGLTSVIEELLSLGADINPQSHDGQTPLHLAIKLCPCQERQVESTPALQLIMEEGDQDMSAEKALVQLLLHQGSKIDIKNKDGFIPVQYTKDELIRQMVFQRAPNEESLHELRAFPMAKCAGCIRSRVGCEGGILYMEGCDITMSIPSLAVLPGSCYNVSIGLATETPEIHAKEFLAGQGVECILPERLITPGELTVTVPHAASVGQSSDGNSDIIWSENKSGAVNRIHSSDTSNIHCILKERDFKFTIDDIPDRENNIQLWMPLNRHHHANGKRLVCTPFLPLDIKQRNDVKLRVYIHEDLPDIALDIQRAEDTLLYRQAHPARSFLLEPESHDLVLMCGDQEKTLLTKDLFHTRQTLISLSVCADAQPKMIQLSMRAGDSTERLFGMSFMAQYTGTVSNTKSTEDVKTHESKSVPKEEDFRSKDHEFVKEMTVIQYYHLGVALGLSYRTLDSIQYRCRKDVRSDSEVKSGRSINQRAALQMVCQWESLHGQDPTAGQYLKEIWESVKGAPPSQKTPSEESEKTVEGTYEDIFNEETDDLLIPTLMKTDSHLFQRRRRKMSFPKLITHIDKVLWHLSQRSSRTARTKRPKKRASLDRILSIDMIPPHLMEKDADEVFGAGIGTRGFDEITDRKAKKDTPKSLKAKDVEEGLQLITSTSVPENVPDHTSVLDSDSTAESSEDSYVISLEEYHIEVRIPPGEPYSSNDVIVEAIKDVPPDLVLKDEEVVISLGLKLSPSDRRFSSPVKVTMLHSGIFDNPEKAQIVLYTRRNSSDSFSAIPSTTNGMPRCVVRQRDLDLYVNHFSEWWIVAFITRVFIGKRIICTPYFPISITRNSKPFLHLCLTDDNNGIPKEIAGYKVAFRERQYFVKWRHGDLRIDYYRDAEEMDTRTIPEQMFHYLTDVTESFRLDTDRTTENQVCIKFTLKQSIKMDIDFDIDISGNASVGSTSSPPRSQSRRPSEEQYVSDAHIWNLSKLLTPNLFYGFHIVLGIDYSIAEGIRNKTQDISEQFMHLLQKWKAESPRTLKELNEALVKADAGGLVDNYL